MTLAGRLAWRAALLCGAGLLSFRLLRRFDRYEIVGESMLPALRPGDFVLVDGAAFRSRPPRPGDVVLARDPREPRRTVVKRVASVDPTGDAWLLGDNAAASTDSRSFGSIPASAILGRVTLRYWPPWRPSSAS